MMGPLARRTPVGLLFRRDLDRVWSEARTSALPTHRHPVGVKGAQLIALTVALAARGDPFDRTTWFDQLLARAVTDEFRHQLTIARQLGPTDPFNVLGSSPRADQSIVVAIACFASSPNSYPNAIARAIAMGDDTDTVAAMAGAISGAYLDADAVPAHLLEMREDGPKGRGYIEQLAGRLAEYRPE